MHAKNLAEMHRLISEGIGKIQGIIGAESFVEMKRRKKQTPYMVD